MKIVLSVIEKKLIHQLYSKYNMTVLIQKREMVDTTSFKMTIYNFSSSFFEVGLFRKNMVCYVFKHFCQR